MDEAEYQKLRALKEVYMLGTVSAAAASLKSSQSTVSYTLEQLRRDLKDPLFVKVGRNITPTDFLIGRMPVLMRILAALESLPKRTNFHPATYTGEASVVANVTELMPQLAQLIGRFREEAPLAKLRLLELGSRKALLDFFDEGSPSFAITVRFETYPAELMLAEFHTSPLAIFYDPDQRGPVETVEDYFAAEHAVLDFGGKSVSTVEKTLSDQERVRKIRLAVPNVAAMAQAIKGRPVICTMQKSLHRDVLSGLACCEPPFPSKDVVFDIVWHRRQQHDPISRWLRSLASSGSRAP